MTVLFFKPAEVELAQCKASYRRLKEEGKHELIRKYIKPLTALGVLEAETIGRTMEEFEAADYEKQLKESRLPVVPDEVPIDIGAQPSEMVN